MRPRVLAYAAGMLITGSINTIATKYQDKTVVGTKDDGQGHTEEILFQHPAFQSGCMFLGEALCLVAYAFFRWRRRAIKAAQGIPSKPKPPTGFYVTRTLAFVIPTLCDATGTTLLNVGLFYTSASTYQMLRGTLVLFTGFFTIMLLKRRLYLHHWLGMVLITAGAVIVGAASMLNSACPPEPSPHPHHTATSPDDVGSSLLPHQLDAGNTLPGFEADAGHASGHAGSVLGGMMGLHWPGVYAAQGVQSQGAGRPGGALGYILGAPVCKGGKLPPDAAKALFGNAMVVSAQAFTAFQFILEEKFLGQFRIQPLLAVGLEGMWGVILCAGAIPLLSLVKTRDGLPVDDAMAAFKALADIPSLRYAVIGSIISIGAFNFFGLVVTQALSGANRATIDACRTILIWAFSMWAGWEPFRQLQVVGFLVLLSGTSLYNELIRSCLPGLHRMGTSLSSLSDDEGDEEGGEGQGGQPGDVSIKAGSAYGGAGAVDEEAGTGLKEPLLAAEGGPAPKQVSAGGGGGSGGGAAIGRQSRSQRISGTGRQHQGRSAHHGHHTTTMARSMRLGINALSPHDLADDADDETEPEDNVANPMMLAATPYFGQSTSLMAYTGDQGSSRASFTSTEDQSMHGSEAVARHATGDGSTSATALQGSGVAQGGERGWVPAVGGGSQQGVPRPAAQPPGQQAPVPEGGFRAFMAARQQEGQPQPPSQPPRP